MLTEPNPVFLRHLRGAVRRNTLYWLLTLYLILAISLFLLVLTMTTFTAGRAHRSLYTFATAGQSIFWTASVLLLTTAWLFAPLPALGMIAGEHSHRTLALLKLTTIPRRSITLGKMGAALLQGGLFIITPLPIFFYGFWLGGISFVELGLFIIILLATFIGSVAIAMLLSSYSRSTIVAVLSYYGLIFLSWMIAGMLSSTLGMLTATPTPALDNLPLPLAIILYALPPLLSGLYPISAAVATEIYWIEQHRWLFIQITLPRSPSLLIYLPSPWLTYTILTLLLFLLSILLVTRRLEKKER